MIIIVFLWLNKVIGKKREGMTLNKRIVFVILSVLLLVIVSACSDKEKSSKKEGEFVGAEVSKEELVDNDKVIATVNGKKITGEQYNSAYRERKEFEMFNKDPEEDIDKKKVSETTIEGLIGQELINQEAIKLKIDVKETEVEKELATLKEEQQEMLDSLMEQFKWTEENVKNQIKQDLTNGRYISETIDVKVTEKEIKAEYDRVKKDTEKLPEFDEVKENIEIQMIKQKQNKELEKQIEKLKKSAKIEIKL